MSRGEAIVRAYHSGTFYINVPGRKRFVIVTSCFDTFEADTFIHVVNRDSIIIDINSILKTSNPSITMAEGTTEMVATFELFGNVVLIALKKLPSAVEKKLEQLEAHMERLEKSREKRDDTTRAAISAALRGNDLSQLDMLLNLSDGCDLSGLRDSASRTIMMDSNEFERLVEQKYDLRYMRDVERLVCNLINTYRLAPNHKNFETNFARVIALANVDWSTTKEDIRWTVIRQTFEGRMEEGERYGFWAYLPDHENVRKKWQALQRQARDAIVKQIEPEEHAE